MKHVPYRLARFLFDARRRAWDHRRCSCKCNRLYLRRRCDLFPPVPPPDGLAARAEPAPLHRRYSAPACCIAFPNMLQRFATSLGYVVFASMINSLGEISTAAHTIANTVEIRILLFRAGACRLPPPHFPETGKGRRRGAAAFTALPCDHSP